MDGRAVKAGRTRNRDECDFLFLGHEGEKKGSKEKEKTDRHVGVCERGLTLPGSVYGDRRRQLKQRNAA